MKIYIDGQLLDETEAKVSVFDHGLLYGDGVFEGIRFYNGRVFELEAHIARLFDSARAILLEIPRSPAEVTEAVLETVRANGLTDGYVRLVVTRGAGTLGLNPFHCPAPTIIVIASSIALYTKEKYELGLKLVTCSTRRLAPAALSPQIKSLNYLNNIMAKIEALNANADEGLILNEQGYVSECTGDNVFVIKNGVARTPPVASGALAGITRDVVIGLAGEIGIPVVESDLTRYNLYTADECFLTGTAAEVIPVVELDMRSIGDGKPGTKTAQVTARFHDLVGSVGTRI